MIEDEELHLHDEYSAQADHGSHSEDRLPWLEAVEPDADHEHYGARSITGWLVAGVLALGLLLGGLWYMNSQTPPVKTGDGNLIAAAEGDYKTKPADAGGMKVDGQGDTAAAAAQGADSNGKIDQNAKPEAPIAPAAAKPTNAKAAAPVAAKPNATAKIADVRDVTPKPAPGDTLAVRRLSQLLPTRARAAWKTPRHGCWLARVLVTGALHPLSGHWLSSTAAASLLATAL
jgi:hypothetical protein